MSRSGLFIFIAACNISGQFLGVHPATASLATTSALAIVVFLAAPLAGCCDPEKPARVVDRLRTRCFCLADLDCVAVPSYDMCQADYDGAIYWRRPVWLNINWLLAKGLYRHGQPELADWIEESLLRLAIRSGFYEYYSPQTGHGLGASDFSWTAALFLDLAAKWQISRNVNTRQSESAIEQEGI